jgi:hypothetical protein
MKTSKELQQYAALDAYLHLAVYQKLVPCITEARATGKLAIPKGLSSGREVELLWHNKVCGRGLLVFIGGEGEICRWGQMTIGRSKTLVMLQETVLAKVRPALLTVPPLKKLLAGSKIKGWDHSKVSIGEILKNDGTREGILMAWLTGRVRVRLNCNIIVNDDGEIKNQEEEVQTNPSIATNSSDKDEAQNQSALNFFRHYGTNDDYTDIEDDPARDPTDDLPRTRQKADRFHVFDSFPSSREPETKAALTLIRRLVIQGTIEFDPDDWEDKTECLSKYKGISNLDDVLEDFHYNQEKWYRNVRIYPPASAKGMAHVKLIKILIMESPCLNIAWNSKLETLFYDGSMEECGDVSLYQWDGVDKHGLNCWLRRRGSTRSELLHQKMKVAFGPHGVGVEVGHFLLLLVTYIFNVNTGVRRTRCHDFGMPWHHIIDRIQIRSIQIFGVDFPRHENQSPFQPIQGFVAVGVGPLNYDDAFVEQTTEPHPNLTGGMRFLAQCMKR